MKLKKIKQNKSIKNMLLKT